MSRRSESAAPQAPRKIQLVKVPGYSGTSYELGQAIINLRGDELDEVVRGMLNGLEEKVESSAREGRADLSKILSNAYIYLHLVLVYLRKALHLVS